MLLQLKGLEIVKPAIVVIYQADSSAWICLGFVKLVNSTRRSPSGIAIIGVTIIMLHLFWFINSMFMQQNNACMQNWNLNWHQTGYTFIWIFILTSTISETTSLKWNTQNFKKQKTTFYICNKKKEKKLYLQDLKSLTKIKHRIILILVPHWENPVRKHHTPNKLRVNTRDVFVFLFFHLLYILINITQNPYFHTNRGHVQLQIVSTKRVV